MGAVAVFLLRDDVRLAEIPVNDAFADVLFRESKGKSTTSCLAEMNAIFAVDLRLTRPGRRHRQVSRAAPDERGPDRRRARGGRQGEGAGEGGVGQRAVARLPDGRSDVRQGPEEVRGRVQGVGYRWFASRAAQRLGVVGYARNLVSGDVEIHAQAEETVLDEFKEELRRGPHAARVSEVIEQDLPVSTNYSSFHIG